MKYTSGFKTIASSVVLGVALSASSVMANEIDYTANTSSYITFDGSSHFSFAPSTENIVISGGSANAFLGTMTGSFTIGTVVAGDAPVTGSGTFTIEDGGTPLTATLTWGDIYTHGTGGTVNSGGIIDLTGISYLGSNPDLVALAGSGAGINVLTFQFVPALSVSQLKSTSTETSFSGSITPVVPDGGTTVALLGGALLAIGGLRRKIGR